MRDLRRNKRVIYYANFVKSEPVVDSDGNETSEQNETFTDPARLELNVSAASGSATAEAFGGFTDYSRTISVSDLSCQIKKGSRIWFNRSPSEPHNYEVVAVADGVTSLLFALKEVAF